MFYKLKAGTTIANKAISKTQFLVRRVADMVVGRRLKKRSLLEVNEHFSGKADAERANKTMQKQEIT